jgi:hypothetical protein
MAARHWTPEQRRQQAEKIQAWSPWAQSTGPRTVEGKAAAARNAWRSGQRAALRRLSKEMKAALAEVAVTLDETHRDRL